MKFSNTAYENDKAPDAIPRDLLTKALLVVKEVKTSGKGGTFLDLELRLMEGRFEKRRVFDMVMNPFDENNSPAGRAMGQSAITRILEAIGIFDPADPDSYNRYDFEGASIDHVVDDIHEQPVAILTKIEKGTDGRADRARVAEWLSPNPARDRGYKGWVALSEGKETISGKPLAATGPASRPASAFGGGGGSSRPSGGGGNASWLTGPGQAGGAGAASEPDESDDIPF